MVQTVIAIDLGGTSIKYALVNENYKILFTGHMDSLASTGADQVIEQIKKSVQECLDYATAHGCKALAIGLGSPGITDKTNKIIVGGAENIVGWDNIPLANLLTETFQLPTQLANDANLMALGEATAGVAKGKTDVICLTIGTGIGGGMVIRGKLYGGYHSRGGELGHVPLIANGEPCSCGSVGCLEQYASTSALVRRYTQQAILQNKALPEKVNGRYILSQYALGETLAIEQLNEHCYYVGRGVAGYINIFSPQMVVIGGGISESGAFYIEKIREVAMEHCISECAVSTSIQVASLGGLAGCYGAAKLAFDIE